MDHHFPPAVRLEVVNLYTRGQTDTEDTLHYNAKYPVLTEKLSNYRAASTGRQMINSAFISVNGFDLVRSTFPFLSSTDRRYAF